uniref:ELM2 domain-containing protein n=1 Tax=Strongyloides stercoralis TaxID=6248 RepID=A0A0K0E5V1_STRER
MNFKQEHSTKSSFKKQKINEERTFFDELHIRRSRRIQHIPIENELFQLTEKGDDLYNNNFIKNDISKNNVIKKLNIGSRYQAIIPECKPKDKIQKTTEILIWDYKQDNADKWSIEKQEMVYKFAKAIEDYGYDYLEALNILRQYNYDPIESSRHVEAYIPHHSFKRFSSEEESLLNACKKKAGRGKKKQQIFQQMVHESKRTHKEIVEHYYKTKKHACERGRNKCWCKKNFFIKPKKNIIKRKDCKNCRDYLYLKNDIDLKMYSKNDNLLLCSICKFYFKHTNKMRIPSVKFNPLKSNDNEKNQQPCGEMEQINIPESHVPLILHELEAHSLDIRGTLEGLRENHGVDGYSQSHIRWFITTQAHKYNIHFDNCLVEGQTVESGNLETKEGNE